MGAVNRQILTFTNLFPRAACPEHGCFVKDRMQRVAEHSGLPWRVLCPVPRVPRLLRRREYRVMAGMPRSEVVEGTVVDNVPYLHLPGISTRWHARRIARACLPVVRELTRGVRTVIDAHYVYPDGVAAMAIARTLNLPCVVTARGSDLNVLGQNAAVARQIAESMSDAVEVLAVSQQLAGVFDDFLGERRTRLVRNGVDLERFKPGDKVAARAELGLPIEGALVLGVGRLCTAKGFHHAAAALGKTGSAATLVLVGEGPERTALARMLPEGRLIFLGGLSRDRVALAYRACDLLVLPTYREGWPNVVTEALATGLPVVASAVGGIPAILAGSDAGALLECGDEVGLAREIDRFLASPPDPAQVRALAARYSWEEPVSLLSTLLSEVLS